MQELLINLILYITKQTIRKDEDSMDLEIKYKKCWKKYVTEVVVD